eukprot:9469135-Alexandrium_andersonii.AAC.1
MARVCPGRIIAAVCATEEDQPDISRVDLLGAEEGGEVKGVRPFLHHHPQLGEVDGIVAGSLAGVPE